MTREEFLKEKIKEHGSTLKEFAKEIEMPYTTLLTILSRGVGGASIDNVFKICHALGISADELSNYGVIPPTKFNSANTLLNELGYNLGLTDDNQYRLYDVDSSQSDIDITLSMDEFDELINTASDILGYTVDKFIKSRK